MNVRVNCNDVGHNFVESSLGRGPEPAQKVYIFCARCGAVKVIKAEK